MEVFPLSAPPAEIRALIIEQTFTYSEPIILVHEHVSPPQGHRWRRMSPKDPLTLPRTCRAMYQESRNQIVVHNTIELRGLSTEGMLSGLEYFRKTTGMKAFAKTRSISILPVELDMVRVHEDLVSPPLSMKLVLAIAKVGMARSTLVAARMVVKCTVGDFHEWRNQVLYLAFDVEHLDESCRLVEWEAMGELLSHPEHEELPRIYEELQKCTKHLRHLGLLPRS